ncbi:hypothetical protein IC235_01720 [Hymenobacter sp. BT664]|uniref:DUF3575 domain-containing protein n=1 Tax=Hymenobacter montanus TaxID=2771359 RepID=A0A927BAL2_9BACT|nr:hypothetical protein [Hymenobacter montanus]MBD2766608.1 hypothetical protein [Hymenobacter montanus]
MKTIKSLLLSWLFVVSTAGAQAQTVRPVTAESPNAVFVNVGLNQAIVAGTIGYQRRLADRTQLIVGADAAAVPKFLTNSRVYGGLQYDVLTAGRFGLPVRLIGSTAFADNELYKAVNVSTELSLHPQLHSARWTYGADVLYRQGWATHLTHSARYRRLAYAEAKDGWYKFTASTFRIGGSIAHSFDRVEVGLQAGYQANGKYDLFLPPYYGVLMTNFRF